MDRQYKDRYESEEYDIRAAAEVTLTERSTTSSPANPTEERQEEGHIARSSVPTTIMLTVR